MRERALADWDRLIAANPKIWRYYADRGFTLRSLGRIEQALESYEQALRLAPGARMVAAAITKLKQQLGSGPRRATSNRESRRVRDLHG